jgi:hypothetical protein
MKKAELELLGVARHFCRYTSEQRADMAAWHRLGPVQRYAVGHYFWTTEYAPGVGFDTRGRAVDKARAALAEIAKRQQEERASPRTA